MLGPIFNREWLILPRRSNHYLTRALYLGGLWVLLLTVWQTAVGWDTSPTLGDLARFGLFSFRLLAYVQLTLLLFFSALSAASAISLEKDRRTFLLLLITDLHNYEIVLGKLFASLLQIALLLVGSIPVFALLTILGGIHPYQVAGTMLVLGSTALATGSLGGLVALWRDKTFQAIAMTVLFLVLYLCLVRALVLVPYLAASVLPALDATAISQSQGMLDPFQALGDVLYPPTTSLGPSTDPYLDNIESLTAALPFTGVMVVWMVLLNGWGVWKLRVWNPSGEPIMQRDAISEADAAAQPATKAAHAAPGRARPVWANPILWREIATRAYGRRPLLVKSAYFIVLALIAYYSLFVMEPRPWSAAYCLVPVGILSMLLISAQSVTSITSERDLGSLDLLTITDISPREFVLGKIFGILYNTKEYIVPPLILLFVYAARGEFGTPPHSQPELLDWKNAEAAVATAIALIVLIAFTVMLGIHVALRNENSRYAAINTLGTIFFLSIGTMVCIYLILINGQFEYQWLSFAGFIIAGIGGLWWVLSAERPSTALNIASTLCPIAVFYTITNILIGKPVTGESSDPLMPLVVMTGTFGFTFLAMAVPLMSEFDVAIGRSSAVGE